NCHAEQRRLLHPEPPASWTQGNRVELRYRCGWREGSVPIDGWRLASLSRWHFADWPDALLEGCDVGFGSELTAASDHIRAEGYRSEALLPGGHHWLAEWWHVDDWLASSHAARRRLAEWRRFRLTDLHRHGCSAERGRSSVLCRDHRLDWRGQAFQHGDEQSVHLRGC